MKICYFANAASSHTVKWVKYFADKGHEVHLMSVVPYENDKADNVSLHLLKVFCPQIRIVSYIIFLVYTVTQIKGLLRKLNPDILHTHYITDYGFLGALCCFHPLVVTAWGSDVLINPKISRVKKREVEFALRRADLITCDAEHVKAALVELGANPAKINLINFGIDVQKFSPGPKDEELIRKLEISN